VSTPQGAGLIEGRANVSGETCPHYLLYTADDLERLGGLGKCAPPLRDERMKVMPIVVSDHSPCTLDLKHGGDFRKIWGGVSGCQSTRHLLLASGMLDLPTVAAVTSTNIARRFRIEGKGDIAPGYDADLWIVDLDWEGMLTREDLRYRNPFSVHVGRRIRGRTIKTLVRGVEPARGRALTQTLNKAS
jgi:allantoinase